MHSLESRGSFYCDICVTEPDALEEDKDGLDETSPFVASQNEYDSNQRTSEHGSMSLQDRKLDAESSDVLIKVKLVKSQ